MATTSKGKGGTKTRGWEKHLRPFGKKMAAKDVRKDGKKKIKEGEEDEQSVSKQFKAKGKAEFEGPKVKERKKFAPATKVEKSKKSYDRKKENFDESCNITKFIESLINRDYSDANKYIKAVVDSKLEKKIKQELNTPLF